MSAQDERLPGRCERCEEPVVPVELKKLWPSRFFGRVEATTYRIKWTHIWRRVPWERAEMSHTEMRLCDGCWGDLLAWCNEPEQQRRKIAAQHRRDAQRALEVAEARVEQQVQAELRGAP